MKIDQPLIFWLIFCLERRVIGDNGIVGTTITDESIDNED